MLLPIIAALCCVVSAGWLRQLGGGDDGQSWIARETDIATDSFQTGWSPKPTPAPGAQSETGRVLDLLLKRETTSNWTNSETCGWISGVSSSPWTCGDNSTCATNENHIVACILGTLSDFYSVCLDYDAYLASSCQNDDLGTGCCTSTAYGACATYLWTGDPPRSMFRCASSSAVITMLDEPQFVVDASLSSRASRTASAGSAGTDADEMHNTTTHVGSSSSQETTGRTGSSGNVNRLAAIAASSAIGGLACLWLLYRFVFVPCRHRRRLRDREHADIRDRLDAVFDPVGPVALAARDDHPAPASASSDPDTPSSRCATAYHSLTPPGFVDLSARPRPAFPPFPRDPVPPSPSARAGSGRPLGEPWDDCLFAGAPSEAATSSAPRISSSLSQQRFPSSPPPPRHSSRREPLSSSSSLSPRSPFTDSRNDLNNNNNDNPPPPEYSVLNPYPDAAPSTGERPPGGVEDNSSRAGDDGDIELRFLRSRTRMTQTTAVPFPLRAGPSSTSTSTTPSADAKLDERTRKERATGKEEFRATTGDLSFGGGSVWVAAHEADMAQIAAVYFYNGETMAGAKLLDRRAILPGESRYMYRESRAVTPEEEMRVVGIGPRQESLNWLVAR
ncbi:hypothetical protein Hte_006445 [Hypoxylon texense]